MPRFICLEFICDVLARVPIANFKGCLHMLNIIKKDLSILHLSHWLLHLAMFIGSLTPLFKTWSLLTELLGKMALVLSP